MRVADIHVGYVDREEGRLQASASPEIIQPPEHVVLDDFIACHAEAPQGGHALQRLLKIRRVRLAESTVVYLEVSDV